MQFYVPFRFSKVPLDCACLPRAAFRKAKVHSATRKGGKMSPLLFRYSSGIFFMHFYVPFHFFKVRFDFACLPRAPFGKAKAHRGTQKCHFFSSLIKWHFFVHFYVLFLFFKVPFGFPPLPKAAFWKDKAHRGTPKGAKMPFLFFSNRTTFFHAFL